MIHLHKCCTIWTHIYGKTPNSKPCTCACSSLASIFCIASPWPLGTARWWLHRIATCQSNNRHYTVEGYKSRRAMIFMQLLIITYKSSATPVYPKPQSRASILRFSSPVCLQFHFFGECRSSAWDTEQLRLNQAKNHTHEVTLQAMQRWKDTESGNTIKGGTSLLARS